MKVLQINTVCGLGSVGRICMDLYDICEQNQIEGCIAYGRGAKRDDVKSYKIGNSLDLFTHVFWNFLKGESGFHSVKTTKKFIAYLEHLNPDVIHLHNIHGFYLQTELLFDYIKKNNKKVIWTLHDCWPFTGHCAYFDFIGCEKWKKGCHDCAIHASAYPYALFCDSTKRVYPLKKEAFCGVADLTIVTPSRWLADLVKQSFLKEYPVKVIPNGIDLAKFKPSEAALQTNMSKTSADKTASGDEKPYILGVANVWEHRKGLTYFEKLASDLEEQKKADGDFPYRIVLIGLKAKQVRALQKKYGQDILVCMERTQNVEELAKWYAGAAAYVNATLEDNFPTTNLEALACGTPVITFQTGGSGEAVDESCGNVVPKGDYGKLKATVLEVVKTRPFTTQACVERASHYAKDDRFMEYINLYRGVSNG